MKPRDSFGCHIHEDLGSHQKRASRTAKWTHISTRKQYDVLFRLESLQPHFITALVKRA